MFVAAVEPQTKHGVLLESLLSGVFLCNHRNLAVPQTPHNLEGPQMGFPVPVYSIFGGQPGLGAMTHSHCSFGRVDGRLLRTFQTESERLGSVSLCIICIRI